MLIQQGDVLIESTDHSIPSGLLVRHNNHLAEGEVTGHFHKASGEGIDVFEGLDCVFLSAPHGAVVRHQEHSKVDIPPGNYKVRIVQEYDHFLEEARAVQD